MASPFDYQLSVLYRLDAGLECVAEEQGECIVRATVTQHPLNAATLPSHLRQFSLGWYFPASCGTVYYKAVQCQLRILWRTKSEYCILTMWTKEERERWVLSRQFFCAASSPRWMVDRHQRVRVLLPTRLV